MPMTFARSVDTLPSSSPGMIQDKKGLKLLLPAMTPTDSPLAQGVGQAFGGSADLIRAGPLNNQIQVSHVIAQ